MRAPIQPCGCSLLQDSPTAFGSSYETEAALPLDKFTARATFEAENFVIGAFVGDTLVATAGGFREKTPKRRHIATVWGMFVHPQHRRRGLAARLLNTVMDQLAALPDIERLQLVVSANNAAALALYERNGFEVWGREVAGLKVAGRDYDDLHLSRSVV